MADPHFPIWFFLGNRLGSMFFGQPKINFLLGKKYFHRQNKFLADSVKDAPVEKGAHLLSWSKAHSEA